MNNNVRDGVRLEVTFYRENPAFQYQNATNRNIDNQPSMVFQFGCDEAAIGSLVAVS